MEKLDGKSMDIVAENIKKLKEIFPDVFSEGKVDFEALEATLGEYVDTKEERYSFNWNGKTKARRIAQTPSTGTLRPAKEESKDWGTTENLYIEGDNLEVLKLLQKSYHKQVKMIYIDPPYNTGKDFVYKDNFKDNIKNYMEQTGQVDSEGNKLSTNSDTSGRYHSDWLNMMYPRLKLARNLLKDDGVIFISIDDNEMANLRKLCDEIFGENNFASIFTIKSNPRGSQSTIYSANVHESLLCYVKNSEFQNGFSIPLDESMVTEYKLEDESGKYRLLGLRLRGGAWRREERPLLYYPIYINPTNGQISLEKNENYTYKVLPIKPTTQEDGTWRWGKEKFINDSHLIIAKKVTRNDEIVWDIFQKDYLHLGNGQEKGTKAKTIWDEKEVNYQNGTNEVKMLFNKNVFDFPKPTYMLKKCITMSNDKNSLILDFFSGSSTTAHSVMQLNSEDNGDRKYICVQLPEEINEKSEAYKAGYKNICEIGKERIRRAGEKIIADNPDQDLSDLDIGFKVFKLDSSNIKAWDPESGDLEQSLFEAVNNIKSDRTEEDLLYEILLKYGLDLTLPIEELELAGKKVYVVGLGALVICLDEQITLNTVEEIAKLKEQYEADDLMRVVFRDNGFKDAEVKTNAIQILKQSGIDDVKSL